MKLAFLLALIQLIAEPCCAFNPLPCRAYTIQGRCTSLRARHSIPSHSFYSISHFSTGHISRPLAAGAKGSREMATDTDSVGLGRQDILSAAARRYGLRRLAPFLFPQKVATINLIDALRDS